MKKILILSALLLSTSAFAANATGNYAGVQYGMATYSETGFPDLSPSVLFLRAGHKMSKNLAIEGRIGFGIASDSTIISGINLDLKVDSLLSAFAVGSVPVSRNVDVYGLLGLTSGKLTATASSGGLSASASTTESDLSYGFGVNISSSKDMSWNAEYVSYINKSAWSISTLSVGVNFAF